MCVPKRCCTKRCVSLFVATIVMLTIFPLYYLAVISNNDYIQYLLDEQQMNVSFAEGTKHPVPKLIHRTWKNEIIPENWRDTYESCSWRNPSFQHILWTDEKSRQFIQEKYPWFLKSYDSYPYTIQKVDAIRYFILYTYGGIYTDLDVGCKKPSDPLLDYDVLLPATSPVGYSNDVMSGAPGHPFYKQLIEALPYWNHHFGTKYLTVMMSTGPLFVTYQFNIYQQKNNLTRVLPHSLYGSHHSSFFYHTKGSSWHGTDAQFIMWVYNNPSQLVIFVVIFVVIWVLLCLIKFKWRGR